MIRKLNMTAQIQDWITPQQVEVVRVDTHAERLDRIHQRAKELREAMGLRYLCHEKNRVRRLDGRTYRARGANVAKVRAAKHAA